MNVYALLVLLLAPSVSIEVQGHRGARALRPENTLVAFDYALSLGVQVLELDLAVTADQRLVVFHDLRIGPKRCAPLKAPLTIAKASLKQVQALDCGSLPNPRFPKQRPAPGERIPTLEQVFELVARSKHPGASSVHFNIETKMVPGRPDLTPAPEAFARLVVAAVRKARLEERAVVQSFDQRSLLAVAEQAPEIRRALLVAENNLDHVAAARGAKATIVSPHHLWITAEDVKRMHAAGLRVVPWTANTPRAWARLVELGVDGIISDDPAALIKWLAAPR